MRALIIEEDDDLIGAAVSADGDEILLSTRLGMACRFDQTDEQIRPMGRTARGVTGMRFKLEGDDVVAMEVIREKVDDEPPAADDEEEIAEVDSGEGDEAPASGSGPEILVVTTGGMGKRSFVSTYRKTNRGAKGVASIRLRDGEFVINALQIENDDEILLTTERGQLVRIPAGEIRTVGRNSKGVRIMNLNRGDRITGVARLIEVTPEDRPEASATADGTVRAGVSAASAMPAEPVVEADEDDGENSMDE